MGTLEENFTADNKSLFKYFVTTGCFCGAVPVNRT